MRTKKDPQLRVEVFLNAAQELFFTKGYDSTSVRDILDKVGSDSASPSVFYYYFKSKEEIYQEVMERYAEGYVQDMTLSIQSKALLAQRLEEIINVFIRYLSSTNHIGEKNISADIARIYLDIKDRVTGRFLLLFTALLKSEFGGAEDAEETAAFICGGVAEMIRRYQERGKGDAKEAEALAKKIVQYSCCVLQIEPEMKKDTAN